MIGAMLAFIMVLNTFAGCSGSASEPTAPTETTTEATTPTQTQTTTQEPSTDESSLAERLEAKTAEELAAAQKEWKESIEAAELTVEMMDSYLLQPENKVALEVAYLDATDDVLYMSVEYYIREVFESLIKSSYDPTYAIEIENKDNVITLTRENGIKVVLDFNENFIYFDDVSRFSQFPYKSTPSDPMTLKGFDANGDPEYFLRTENVFERTGAPVMIDMDSRFLPMVYRNGCGYLPLQTLNDLFLLNLNMNLISNGEALFLTGGSLGLLSDLYYSVEPGQRSEGMAWVNYAELCLALDLYYGLKEKHDITSFKDFFAASGLTDELLSPDPVVYTNVLYKVAMGYLADEHTTLVDNSHYIGKDVTVSSENALAISVQNSIAQIRRYAAVRDEFYPSGVPGYEEIDNTAYITFDKFLNNTKNYYSEMPDANAADTMGLVIYAHSQIMRENSPIENVVIDLSNNTGGQADSAIYIIGWILGSCNLSFVDSINGAQSSLEYMSDVNLDRKFDESDSVSSKNLYCIISPNSFSCGNMVPAAFKSSGRVTLIGQPSGGGACVVKQGSTADGTLFSYSGNRRISIVNNGTFADVDNGIVPDVILTKLESFYDRELLTEYINNML